ncbi:MAG TPA: hypothetical protein VGZ48_08380 [Candidatus Acidoferrales bacterium]|jgi:hypothetical protein|nr:hypothetical protein [Candidatus Acidoferrales bacterium]
MTKSETTRLAIMLPILAILLILAYTQYRGSQATAPVFDDTGNFQPLAVENPSLRFDLLAHLHSVEYSGRHRNIFDDKLPPPPPPVHPAGAGNSGGPVIPGPPPGPPPLVFPMKCFGYVEGPAPGMRRAFFTDGEDVFIAGVGDTIINRFRLVRIGNDSVEVQELGSDRRATVAMEQEQRSP